MKNKKYSFFENFGLPIYNKIYEIGFQYMLQLIFLLEIYMPSMLDYLPQSVESTKMEVLIRI